MKFVFFFLIFTYSLHASVSFLETSLVAESETDSAILSYFRWEREILAGKIHAASKILGELSELCDRWEEKKDKPSANRAALCALVLVEEVNRTTPIRQISLIEKISKNLETVEREKLGSPEERLWVEARVYSRLPPSYGQNFKTVFFSLESLSRMRPELSATRFFIGEARLLQGNSTLAEEEFSKSLNDRYTLLQENIKRITDGESYGFTPSVFARPDTGLGLRLRVHDDSVLDLGHRYEIEGTAGTRSYFSAEGKAELQFGNWGFETGGHFYSIKADDYGVGNHTVSSARREVNSKKIHAGIGVSYRIWNALRLGFGGMLEERNVLGIDTSLGAKGFLEYDTRDSRYSARAGMRARVDTEPSFLRLFVEKPVPLSTRFLLKSSGCVSQTISKSSYATLQSYGAACPTPGTRPGRFKDRALFSFWSELDYKIWGGMTMGAFGSLGNVANSFQNLFSETLHPGGGIALEWRFTRFRRADVRLEAGLHGGEFIATVGVGTSL